MTRYRRAKRLHTLAALAGMAFLFVLVAVIGPTLGQ